MEQINFWGIHGFFFIFFMFFFPRLTMIFATSVLSIYGPLSWIGWLLTPRLTVAIISTIIYWDTNPVLCVFTWLWALGGESTEKKIVVYKASNS